MFELKGIIKQINPCVQVSEKFRKQTFVLVVVGANPQYQETIEFQLTQDNCEKINGVAEGQEVQVSFNLKGREWTNPQGEVKCFNTLDTWRVSIIGQVAQQRSVPVEQVAPIQEEINDDLPF